MKCNYLDVYEEYSKYGGFVELWRYSYLPGRPYGGYVLYYGQKGEKDVPYSLHEEHWEVLPDGTHNAEAIRKAVDLFDHIAQRAALRVAVRYALRDGGWMFCPVCGQPLRLDGERLYALAADGEERDLGEAAFASCYRCGEGGLIGRLVSAEDMDFSLPELI